MKSPLDQKISDLLTKEEHEIILRLLGIKCQSLATSVIQLYVTKPPNHSQWIKKDTGVMCFVKDNQKRNYFFRLYCLNRRMMIWEQELYNNLEYITSTEYFHSFEADDCMVAFNFAKEEEAHDLRRVVNEKLLMKRQKREERKNKNNQQKQTTQPHHQQQYTKPSYHSTISLNDQFGQQNLSFNQLHGNRKDKKSSKKITKADISHPSDFKHVTHIGWDPSKGFDIDNVEDPHLKQFFNKAGVSDKQLRDRDTREFIYDFLNKHASMQNNDLEVESEQIVTPNQKVNYPLPKTPNENTPLNPPPVPARTTRSAPPPPPGKTTPKPPPVNRGQPPPRPTAFIPKVAPEPPSPHVNNAPPPPPPPTFNNISSNESFVSPPPPPSSAGFAPPPPPSAAVIPPPPPSSDVGAPPVNNARSALMDSIRSGTTLKPVEQIERKASVGDTRNDLLKQIKEGIELKPVSNTPRPAIPDLNNSLAAALSVALQNRALAIHSESESSTEDDEDWD